MKGLSILFALKKVKLVAFWLALLFHVRLGNAVCLSEDTHLDCFPKDLLLLADICNSTNLARSDCPRQTDSAKPLEWISEKPTGAWMKVILPKALRMTKVIIQQRTGENSQIKGIVIEFDFGPDVQMTLTQNVINKTAVFDQKTFAPRSSLNVKFAILSFHTYREDGSSGPGFKTIQIYDENCDRDYQELNIDHRSLATKISVVRSWAPFTGKLKMFLRFYSTLEIHFADSLSQKAYVSYQFIFITSLKTLHVYKVKSGNKVLMHSEYFGQQFYYRPSLLYIHKKSSQWVVGNKYRKITIGDTAGIHMRYWGITCSSLKPVELTYWKHIGKCYQKADYYWLADKLIGGTTIPELRQGKDGHIRDLNEVQMLPYGPLVDGQTSSSLYLSGACPGGLSLAKFHNGCISDVTTCNSGFTMAFWISALDAKPANENKQLLWLSNFGFSLTYKSETSEVQIMAGGKDYTLSFHIGRKDWFHVFIFWDLINGVKALINNKDEVSGAVTDQTDPSRPGFASFHVGQKPGALTRCARMAIRDIALWERRISIVEAREYYLCNNFEIPREFTVNHRAIPTTTGTFPLPEQNIASLKHGGSCASQSGACHNAIDADRYTRLYVSQPTVAIILKFDQEYIINKVLFTGHIFERNLTIKFSDGATEKFYLASARYGEIYFEDKSINSMEVSVESLSADTYIYEISVSYDFSRDRLPSSYINWALGCQVTTQDANAIRPFITDGSIYGDYRTVISTNEEEAPTTQPASSSHGALFSSAASTAPVVSNFIQIKLTHKVGLNLLRLWLRSDVTLYDHLKLFTLEFPDGKKIQYRCNLPDSSLADAFTYFSEFLFKWVNVDAIKITFLDTHEMSKGKIAINEVELFFDPSKALFASKTIIDGRGVQTTEKELSSAKFGPFDFYISIGFEITQANVKFIGRKNDRNLYRTMIKTTDDYNLHIRIGVHDIYSVSNVADGSWKNVKLFYNARESMLSLFVDNRLESTLIALVPEEADGWEWETGTTLTSGFTGTLRNFVIFHDVRGFGVENHKIQDSALSVSSASSDTTGANKARLRGEGAWVIAPKDDDQYQYLQVDLGIARRVVYVAFQGNDNMWVTSARISYSMDALEWTFFLDVEQKWQIFNAAEDAKTVARVMLPAPVVARYIRIYPYLSNVGMALKTEIYDYNYGLPFNSLLRFNVPSYKGCIKREDFFKLKISLPKSFKSSKSTPEDCKHACGLEGYKLAGLFQGSVCYCTDETMSFTKLADDRCSYPCSGNPVFHCGGESTVSLYEVTSPSLCTDCTVGIYSEPVNTLFQEQKIFTNSSGKAVVAIDVSLNGVHIVNVTSGEFEHTFVDSGLLHIIAEARDSLERQVAVATTEITAQYGIFTATLTCPEWVLKGETYECKLYVQRGTGTNVNCTIDGEDVPLEIDDNMLYKTGDILQENLASVDNDGSTTILPTQATLLTGIIAAFEFVTTGPGSLHIKIFRPTCEDGTKYCQTNFKCLSIGIFSKDCPQGNPPRTAHTFPSTGRICDASDSYCPTKKSPSNLTSRFQLVFDKQFKFSRAGVHAVMPGQFIRVQPGDMVGYSDAVNLQYKTTGVSFRAEEREAGFYTPVVRIEGRVALLRGYFAAPRELFFNLNKTGELNCEVGNNVSQKSLVAQINVFEVIEDVVLILPNVSATNQLMLISVPGHPGLNVNYTFHFGDNATLVVYNRNSYDGLNINHTFTHSGYYQVNLTVNNIRYSVNVTSWIRVVVPITELTWDCPMYLPMNGQTSIAFSAKSGQNVTVTLQFGDGHSVTHGQFDFVSGTEKSLPHTYTKTGSYNISIIAENAVNLVYLTGVVFTMEPVDNVTLTIESKSGTMDNTFPLEAPLIFSIASNGDLVSFSVNFGDSSAPVVTENTSMTHLYQETGSYTFTVNASNIISHKVASVSITLMQSVQNILIETDGPVKFGEPMTFEISMKQMGTFPCYYFNLGDGTEFIYRDPVFESSCPKDFQHVTDIRDITSFDNIQFTHTYTNITVYQVTCVGSNPVSSEMAKIETVVVNKPCTSPVVSIEGLTQSVETAREFMRSEEFEIITKNTVDCEATSVTDFEWKVFKVAPQGFSEEESVEISLPDIKMDHWKIVFTPRSLGYGLYYIRFTLTMVGVEGVSSSTFGYIKITPSPIVAEVRGGSTRIVGFNKMILLDGGMSSDPDVEKGNYDGMFFFWHCKRSDDNYTFPAEPEPIRQPRIANITNGTGFVDFGGCFGQGPGRMNYSSTTRALNIDTGLMRENASYTLQLLVKKDSRRSLFSLLMKVITGDPPTVALSCLRNCLEKFNPSIKVSLEVTCQDCRNADSMNYRWDVYLENDGLWDMLDNRDDIVLTRPSSPNLVIKEDSLIGNRTYKIRVAVWRPGGNPGIAELERTVNIPPVDGWCHASPSTGYALDTLYGITCGDWKDDNLPLRYTFSYFPGTGILESLVYVGENSFSPNVTFPTGQDENNTLYFVVLITDSLDASTLVQTKVQVKPTNTDALKSKVEDLTSTNGTLGNMLSSGDTQNAFQIISAVGNMLNFESEKTKTSESVDPAQNATENNQQDEGSKTKEEEEKKKEAKKENTKLRTSLVNVISNAPVKTLEDAHRTSAVLGTVTKETGEVSQEAQETATSTLATVGDVLESEADKPGTHPRTVAKTAEAVLSGLGNVIQAAFFVEEPVESQQPSVEESESGDSENSKTSQSTEAPPVNTEDEYGEETEKKEKKKELADKLMSVVKKVAKAVTTNKVPGEEATRIDTPYLSLEVYRENPEELNSKVLAAGSGSFALPKMSDMLNGSGICDVSTVATPTNPYEDEANRVHSVVMTTEIRNASGGISVSDLDEPIDIRLPRDPKPVPSDRVYEATAGKMIMHKFPVAHNDSSISIELNLVGNCSERANFSLYLQKQRKPSVHHHMFNITIPDYDFTLEYNNRSKSPNTFFVSNVDLNRQATGTFYVGVMYNRPSTECPELMNYTLNIYTSGCLYYDEDEEIWKGDGCTVGFLTNMNETQCLCNHLTSFGGDFVVAPNSIDWDAVAAGFSNLDENPIVFAVVLSIICLYFIVLLWVRRKDKKDLEEFVTILLPDNDPRDNYNYEVTVYTGHPNDSGTTAKVFIIISGSEHDTDPRALVDSTNNALKAGGVDTYILSVPAKLGKIDHVRVWHDNTGDSPSWYLNRILIRDVQTNRKTWFLCDQWFAVEEDDGLIDRVLPAATKDDLTSFNFLFSIEARRKLFDEHLWFSVISRRPRNQFTRAQRLSCCLAFLLSTMLANAMFYQTDDSSSSNKGVRVGPLVFSLKQLWIGFISCLVILPVNLLIVYIFRNVRPKEEPSAGRKNSDNARKYALDDETENNVLSDPTENLVSCSKNSLPRKFIYLAYILLFLTISVSATFTIFYGFTFGKEKSEQWISSTLISFVQDLMLLQPLKVFAAATIIALIIKDPNKVDQGDTSDTKPEIIEQDEGDSMEDEEKSIFSDDNFREARTPRSVVKPLAEAQLVAVRELRTKQKKMRRIISEVCWYIAYLVLISIVAYGNRDPKAYLVTKTMNDLFVENKYTARLRFEDISSIQQFWSWFHNSILPAISPPFWYGPYGLDDIETISKTVASKSRAKAKSKSTKTKTSGSSGSDDLKVTYHNYPKQFTADRAVSYVVGLARARQLRNTPEDSCDVHPTVRHLHRQCNKKYSWSDEDEGCYNVSWSAFNGTERNCQQMKGGKSAWTYRTALDLKGTPFWGKFHNYWGGGYVWNLDNGLSVIQQERKMLEKLSWLDERTRAIFFEFTVYNAFTNFFCTVTLLLEKQITGGVYPYGQLHALRLYHYVGAEAFVTLVGELIFLGVLCYLFTRELKEARSSGIKQYFKDPWNYFDILGLLFSFAAIGLYFARMAATSLALKQINESRNNFVSFHYVSAIDQSFTILLGLAVFVYFMKVLRLLRFNRKISLLSTTLIACTETLVGFLLTYLLLFAAYAQLMYLVYGRDMPEFATYQRCLSGLMEMTLGSSDFDGMNATNRILTSFIFFSYTILNTCVYMNLFISILSETFSKVRADVLLQPNDYEIVDFMIKSVKKTILRQVTPMTDPIYKEPKDDIDLGVDKISETSECIQCALQGQCKEDIRQTLWFGDKSKLQEKRLLLNILLESGEILTENDIGDAIPLFDDILKKYTLDELLLLQDNQRRRIALELEESFSSSSRFSRGKASEMLTEDGASDGNGECSSPNANWDDDAGNDGNIGDGSDDDNAGDYDHSGVARDDDGDHDDNNGDCDYNPDFVRNNGDSDCDPEHDNDDYDHDNGEDSNGDESNNDGNDADSDDPHCGAGDGNDSVKEDGADNNSDDSDCGNDDDQSLHDAGSNNEDNASQNGGDFCYDGHHSESDNELNGINQQNINDLEKQDPDSTDSTSHLSPRSHACVISMEPDEGKM